MTIYCYRYAWGNNSKRATLKGRLCRVIARLAFNSAVVEFESGQWTANGGRHARDGDREKLNAAAVLGWRVLHYSGAMLHDPLAVVIEVVEALEVTC